jgi:hypothetical protein
LSAYLALPRDNVERMSIIEDLKEFIENETRSCSMDFGCITPEYVYRMLGGQYSIDEIQDVLSLCLKEYYKN